MATRTRETSESAPAQVLERGDLYFFYRPKIEDQVARGPDDVSRLYLVMHPRRRRTFRLMIVGEKYLPAVGSGDRRAWAFVEKVGLRPEEVEDELDPHDDLTQTRGERHVPAARPAGEGVYALSKHGDHTHLAYALELPQRPGDVQRALGIVDEGSYVISVKDPDAASPPRVGLDPSRRARFPASLRARFDGHRFVPVDPPDFLDHEGAELLLIGATKDVRAELGFDLHPAHESAASAEIFRQLKVEKAQHVIAPLFQGRWA